MQISLENVDLNELTERCVGRSETFQKAIQGAAAKVMVQSLVVCQPSNYFRELALALVIRTMLCKQGQQGSPNPSISSRISLITSFVQGVNCTKDLIQGGYHAKAAAVLKQDYELLTRIREVVVGEAKDGSTPNVKHAPAGSQRIYGALNDFAHPSKESLMIRHLEQVDANGIRGVSPFPVFRKRTVELHWWTHVWLIYEVSREALKLLAENYGEQDANVLDCFNRFQMVEEEGLRCGVLLRKENS